MGAAGRAPLYDLPKFPRLTDREANCKTGEDQDRELLDDLIFRALLWVCCRFAGQLQPDDSGMKISLRRRL